MTRRAIERGVVPSGVPERFKTEEFQAEVVVDVLIDARGKARATLLAGSGNAGVDKWLLETVRRWKWKPALRDGEPVESTRGFRFKLTVE